MLCTRYRRTNWLFTVMFEYNEIKRKRKRKRKNIRLKSIFGYSDRCRSQHLPHYRRVRRGKKIKLTRTFDKITEKSRGLFWSQSIGFYYYIYILLTSFRKRHAHKSRAYNVTKVRGDLKANYRFCTCSPDVMTLRERIFI